MAISLTKTTRDGKPYQRRTEIQQLIIELEELTPDSLVQRATDYDNPIPMEALVYFLRQNNESMRTQQFEALFKTFLINLEISLKKAIPERKCDKASDIRQAIMDRLVEMIAREKNGEEALLDYYEVNFNDALASLRVDMMRRMCPENNADPLHQPVQLFNDEIEIFPEVEKRAAEFWATESSKLDDPVFRSKLFSAIKDLPKDERNAVSLFLQGMQIESENPDTVTISKVLGCTSRTIRNRLNRAYTKLREVLFSEEEL